MQSGSKAVLQSFAAKIGIVALNAATGMLTARLLQPSGRGELAAILLWPQILSGVCTLGMPSSITFQLRRKPNASGALLSAALLIGSAFGLIMTAVVIWCMPYFLRQYSHSIVVAARWVVLNTITGVVLLIGRSALEANDRFSRSNIILILPPSLTIVGLVLCQALHILTPISASICYVVAGLPSLLLVLIGLSKSFRGFDLTRLQAARTLLSYGVRSYGIELCGTLSLYVDQVLVITLLSPESMGVYVVALSLSRVLNALHQSIAMVLFPRSVGIPSEEVVELTGRALRASLILSGLGALFLILTGPMLLTLLYGPRYRSVNTTLQVLALEAVLSGCVTVAAQAFMALDRPGEVTLFQLGGLLTAVPLLLVLVPRFGVLGAAFAVLGSTIIRLALTLLRFGPTLGHPRPKIIPTLADLHWLIARLTAIRRRQLTTLT